MMGPRACTRVWLAAGLSDMRCGMKTLAATVQTALTEDPYGGHVFDFCCRRVDLVKLLWSDGDGMCLLAKRLEQRRFVWPQAESGSISLSAAELPMPLDGIDWRRLERTWQPRAAAYRLCQIYACGGMQLQRSTLADWVAQAARLLSPLWWRRGQGWHGTPVACT